MVCLFAALPVFISLDLFEASSFLVAALFFAFRARLSCCSFSVDPVIVSNCVIVAPLLPS